MKDRIPLGLIGVTYRMAPVEVREKVALSTREQEAVIQHIVDEMHAEGCMVISTCNRTEIYVSHHDIDNALDQVKTWLNTFKKCHEFHDDSVTFTLKETDVARHFCQVLSGLDSQIVGEQQIAGQVKDSYDLTHNMRATDALLNKMFNFAMQARKKVYSETFLSDGTVSVSFAGVELARKIFSNLEDKNVLLVGAGKTAELAAYHFHEGGARNINVVNRTFGRAKELADKLDGKAHEIADLDRVLEQSDIVISATSSQEYVITEDLLRPIVKKRHHRPIFLIDLAIPRDIDPAIDEIKGVFLYNLDDLHEIVKANLEKRKKEIPKAMKIINEFVVEFEKWISTNSMTSVVGKLKKKLDVLRLNEMDRLKSKLPQNGYRAEIDNLTESIINKVVRQHVKSLKKVAHDPEKYQKQLDMILHIYDLDN